MRGIFAVSFAFLLALIVADVGKVKAPVDGSAVAQLGKGKAPVGKGKAPPPVVTKG
jgi:hypothetical protein